MINEKEKKNISQIKTMNNLNTLCIHILPRSRLEKLLKRAQKIPEVEIFSDCVSN